MRARRMAGICAFAQANGVRVRAAAVETLKISVAEALAIFHPDGCVVEVGLLLRFRLTPRDFPMPVVVCDGGEAQFAAGFTGTRHDPCVATDKALDALLALDWRDYAFAGYPRNPDWSRERERLFVSRLARIGCRPHVFSGDRGRGRTRLPVYLKALTEWLATLPRPCGILAANDEVGEYVLDAAERLGIAVPDSFSVVGVDNDEWRCENTEPPMASVAPDFEHSGRLAAEMLMEMMAHPGAHPAPRTYDSGEVQVRGSLRPLKVHDVAAAHARAFIAAHYAEPIDVAAVAHVMGVGPRMAQVRFARFAGRSIFEEIEDARFAHACGLLRQPNLKICDIAAQCGYRNERTFRNLILKRTGLSPANWRKAHV